MPRKTDKLTIRIDPIVKNALREVAETEHRSISNMVEVLILEKHGQIISPPAKSTDKQHRSIRGARKSKKGAV